MQNKCCKLIFLGLILLGNFCSALALEVLLLSDNSVVEMDYLRKKEEFIDQFVQALPIDSYLMAADLTPGGGAMLPLTKVTSTNKPELINQIKQGGVDERSDLTQRLGDILVLLKNQPAHGTRHIFILANGNTVIQDHLRLLASDLPEFRSLNVQIHVAELERSGSPYLLQQLANYTDGISIRSTVGLEEKLARLFDPNMKANTILHSIPLKLDTADFAVVEIANLKGPVNLVSANDRPVDVVLPTIVAEPSFKIIKDVMPGLYTLQGDFSLVNAPRLYQNFELTVSKLPADVLSTEIVNLTAKITSKPEMSADLQNKWVVQAFYNNEIYEVADRGYLDDSQAFDGVYTLRLPMQNVMGKQKVKVVAQLPGVELVNEQEFEIFNHAASIQTSYHSSFDSPRYEIEVLLNDAVIQPESVNIVANLEDSAKQSSTYTLQPGQTSFAVQNASFLDYMLTINMTGKTRLGREFSAELTPIRLPYVINRYPMYTGPTPKFLRDIIDNATLGFTEGVITSNLSTFWQQFVPHRHPMVQPSKVEVIYPRLMPTKQVFIPADLAVAQSSQATNNNTFSAINWFIVTMYIVFYNLLLIIGLYTLYQRYRQQFSR